MFCGQKYKKEQVWRGNARPGKRKGPKSRTNALHVLTEIGHVALLIKAGGSPQYSRFELAVVAARGATKTSSYRGTDILHRGVHLLRARGFRRHDLSIKLQMLGLNQAANI